MRCHPGILLQKKAWTAFLCCVIVSATTTRTAHAQCHVDLANKRIASEAEAADEVGRCVSISGQFAVVGVRGDDDGGSSAGAAYVYRYGGTRWIEDSKLNASDAAASDFFGESVAISGDVILVAARGDDDSGNASGAVYAFHFDGAAFVEAQKIVPDVPSSGESFGSAVALDANVAVIGADGNDDLGSNAGAAYVFERNGAVWSQVAQLTASDAAGGDDFGGSVAMAGSRIVVGSRLDDDACGGSSFCNSGSVYVFHHDGLSWTEETKLTPSDGMQFDFFGTAVAIHGELVVVRSRSYAVTGGTGAAYVFRRTLGVWAEEDLLFPPDAHANQNLPHSIAIENDLIVVGAPGDADACPQTDCCETGHGPGCDNSAIEACVCAELPHCCAIDWDGACVSFIPELGCGTCECQSGAAYLYSFNGVGWDEAAKMVASDTAPGDQFGHSVSINGGNVIVAAWRDDDAGSDSGSVYFLSGFSDCNSNTTLDLCETADGLSADCDRNGLPDACEPELGDINDDGSRDLGDVPAFVAALVDAASFGANFPGAILERADLNRDSRIDGQDVESLVCLMISL